MTSDRVRKREKGITGAQRAGEPIGTGEPRKPAGRTPEDWVNNHYENDVGEVHAASAQAPCCRPSQGEQAGRKRGRYEISQEIRFRR